MTERTKGYKRIEKGDDQASLFYKKNKEKIFTFIEMLKKTIKVIYLWYHNKETALCGESR